MNLDEKSWISSSPGRENNVIDSFAVLLGSEVESFAVDKKFWQVKEVWKKK